ncbi:single-stranded DNA-binding protein [Prochlorococcus sp. MIT 1307]|uniref:single-stranded DNA-binding protein n=1 Tax=Prochlorococcus sp. MIT 1307 TaxID=3096219 RepID=UPI002A74FC92|nr:single-stranded DNA-binding protein [Prochlorococcus sp. MIT 1307]
MNHCLLEVQVKKAPTIRYTQDNKTPIAEMEVLFEGLRADDPSSELKVVGWGNMAQELQNRVQEGQKLVVEGRLRMNTIPRQDGSKEKRAELTLTKFHNLSAPVEEEINSTNFASTRVNTSSEKSPANNPPRSQGLESKDESVSWNSAPLVPDTDDIPF